MSPRVAKSAAQRTADRRLRWAQAFRMLEEGTASDKVVICVNLVAQGMGIREIAEATGIDSSSVGAYLRDPAREADRRRKARSQRPCLDCGAPCNTDGRITEPALRCPKCASAKNRKWGRPEVIAAIQRWAAAYGEPPTSMEWNSACLSGEAREVFYDGGYPHLNTVQTYFGSWNKAVAAAGFQPRGYGRRAHGTRKKGTDGVSVRLKPEDILQREIERLEGQQKALADKTAEVEEDLERHRAARQVLAEFDSGK